MRSASASAASIMGAVATTSPAAAIARMRGILAQTVRRGAHSVHAYVGSGSACAAKGYGETSTQPRKLESGRSRVSRIAND
jgi:hypothetical protein